MTPSPYAKRSKRRIPKNSNGASNLATTSQLEKPVVLVGMMGAGKTTVGTRLARRLGVDFHDLDRVIEDESGQTISDLFATKGEAYFRELEYETMALLLEEPPHIIASGGGAFVQPRIRHLVDSKAISLWLDASLDTLVERVSRRNTRPLLEQGDKRQIMEELLDSRREAYAQATYRIESSDYSHDVVVDHIMLALTPHLIRKEPGATSNGSEPDDGMEPEE